MAVKYYLAIDIGASNGRHIVGHLENGEIILDEIYRFKNGMLDSKDGLIWDLDNIYFHILVGIKKALSKYENIESLSIDTWGVDYVIIKNGIPIKPFFAYRNSRTKDVIDDVHLKMSFDKLYKTTGIQFQEMNTIYQLYDDKKHKRLIGADGFLMIPEYFTYLLTGAMKKEYTNATTTGLVDADKKEFSKEIINSLEFDEKLFPALAKPGEVVGKLKLDVSKYVGGQLSVVLCPTHDTAAAFEAIDIENDSAFLSSGTWSLIGVKSKKPITNKLAQQFNFTNEGGPTYIRLLKNIMGMWIVNKCLQECPDINFDYLDKNLPTCDYHNIFDVNDVSLVAPDSMKKAICKLLDEDYNSIDNLKLFNSIYYSLAYSYKKAIDELEQILGYKINKIYIVGGGAKNNYLNVLTEKITCKNVVSLPIEATAIGNIKWQKKAMEEL